MAYLSIRKMDERSGKLTTVLVGRATVSRGPYYLLETPAGKWHRG